VTKLIASLDYVAGNAGNAGKLVVEIQNLLRVDVGGDLKEVLNFYSARLNL
jgi:hypothetical protein